MTANGIASRAFTFSSALGSVSWLLRCASKFRRLPFGLAARRRKPFVRPQQLRWHHVPRGVAAHNPVVRFQSLALRHTPFRKIGVNTSFTKFAYGCSCVS